MNVDALTQKAEEEISALITKKIQSYVKKQGRKCLKLSLSLVKP